MSEISDQLDALLARRPYVADVSLPMLTEHARGIDLGRHPHWAGLTAQELLAAINSEAPALRQLTIGEIAELAGGET